MLLGLLSLLLSPLQQLRQGAAALIDGRFGGRLVFPRAPLASHSGHPRQQQAASRRGLLGLLLQMFQRLLDGGTHVGGQRLIAQQLPQRRHDLAIVVRRQPPRR